MYKNVLNSLYVFSSRSSASIQGNEIRGILDLKEALPLSVIHHSLKNLEQILY